MYFFGYNFNLTRFRCMVQTFLRSIKMSITFDDTNVLILVDHKYCFIFLRSMASTPLCRSYASDSMEVLWNKRQRKSFLAVNFCSLLMHFRRASMYSVNSRLQVLGGNTYLGGKFDAFFNVFCILGVFLGGNLRFWGGNPPLEIAGNNTDRCK